MGNAISDEAIFGQLIGPNKEDSNSVYSYKHVVHGTSTKVLDLILQDGLCRMARNHIHMAIGLPGCDGVISGMRYSCDVVIDINLIKAVKSSDIRFYKSSNDVILSPGEGEKGILPAKYIRSAFNPADMSYYYMAPIKYLCILNFKCNCPKKASDIQFNEIPEFTVVILDVVSNKMVHEFHTYVKPEII